MDAITRQSARAILLDGADLILIKRTRPGKPPYWVTPGGGVEPEDADIEAALRREIHEELAGTLRAPQQVFVSLAPNSRGGLTLHRFFLATLVAMDPERRTGPEFGFPENGTYETVRVPFTREGITGVALRPPVLVEFLTANITALTVLAHSGGR
ncbi:NUDIX domain-containing protein [Nocardiopsis ansamitocini]|uniref:Nudix hydrolase domain-containing protein n=1 Tax=Nocardiopsis ansamitocini TaxID=1670832 RepID=A0A9W6UGC6_9ACTN|nr:NUDIX hydrolase [Nocardiopsis ansamitocini]GLU47191.1 hypothetical protein Nans01_15420 [Nocardiopsis ansamitocini]